MKIITKLIALIVLIVFCISMTANFKVSALDLFCSNRDDKGNCIEGLCKKAPSSSVCQSAQTNRGDNRYNNVILRTLNTAINIVAALAGLIAVLMIIIAGFTYATSGGGSDQAKNARNRIIYAGVGLAIIATAWAITRFILDAVIK